MSSDIYVVSKISLDFLKLSENFVRNIFLLAKDFTKMVFCLLARAPNLELELLLE